jgi:FkbM family methyltransferase
VRAKRKVHSSNVFLRFASRQNVTPSIYGPVFQSRWQDLTFQFCVSGYYGRYLSEFLRSRREPFSFIDIGANIGLYSLLAASNEHCIRCYAFEPNPTIFHSLTQNIKLNGCKRIEATNSAVSESTGFLQFSFIDGHTGAGSLVDRKDEATITVSSVSSAYFDKLAARDNTTKIVKIDVEGHEPIVIAELMKSKIWDKVEYIFFECDEARYDVQAVVQSLETNELKQIFKTGRGKPYDLMFQRQRSSRVAS